MLSVGLSPSTGGARVARVFVSYASTDLAVASTLQSHLIAAGHEVFLDRDARSGIQVGEDWKRRLHDELRQVDAVLSVVSRASVASSWCAAEVAIADTLGCRLLPVRVEAGVVQPLLPNLQHADYAADAARAVELLLNTLRLLQSGSIGLRFGNPYPGLAAFTPDLAAFFHGRAAEIRELTRCLQRPGGAPGFLAVVGPSGCGKSSLLGAGVVHRLERDDGWLCLPTWVPGTDPVGNLARSLAAAGRARSLNWTVRTVFERISSSSNGLPQLVEELLDADIVRGSRRVLLPIDQAEEFFTRAAPEIRQDLWAGLSAAVAGPVHAVATLRSEFLDDLAELAASAGVPVEAFVLPPLSPVMLQEVVERPAKVAGLRLEGDLTARLVADTGSGEALPLLAFTLRELAEGLPVGGMLTLARYEAVGGVRGALSRHADAALVAAEVRSRLSRPELLAGLLRLVSVDDAGRRARRVIRPARVSDPLRTALQVLTEYRLLVADSDENGPTLTVAHEALLTAWRPLDEAIDAAAAALGMARAVEQAAEQWQAAGRDEDHLWSRRRLIAAHAVLFPDDVPLIELDEPAPMFLAASDIRVSQIDARERNRRRLMTVGMSVLLVLALAVAGLAAGLLQASRSGVRTATAQDLASRATALQSTDTWTGLRLAVAAHQLDPTQHTADLLLQYLAFNQLSAVMPHPADVVTAAFSTDGRTLATGATDRSIRLWDVSDRERPRLLGPPLTGHLDWVAAVAFAPHGGIMASAGADGDVLLWDVTDLAHPRVLGTPLRGHAGSLLSVSFSADGRAIATTSRDGMARLWDVSEPARVTALGPPLVGHSGPVNAARFAAGGQVLITAGADGRLLLWDLADPYRPLQIGAIDEDRGEVDGLAVDPTRPTLLASGHADGSTILWDIADAARPQRLGQPLSSPAGLVSEVAFVPSQATGVIRLAVASTDSSFALWDVTDPRQVNKITANFPGHTGRLRALAVAPDGRTVATGSSDGTAMLSVLDGPRAADVVIERNPAPASQPAAVGWIGLGHGSDRVVSAGEDGVLRDWTAPAGAPPILRAELVGHDGAIMAGAWAEDRGLLATGGTDSQVRLWRSTDGGTIQPGPQLTAHSAPVLGIALAGMLMATSSRDRTVTLWDVADPEMPRRLGPPLEVAVSGSGTTDVALLPNGQTMITAADSGRVAVWDIGDPRNPVKLAERTSQHFAEITTIALSPDGRTFATGGADYTVILWDLSDRDNPQPIGDQLGAHAGTITTVGFTADGKHLVTASDDGAALLWDVADLAQPELLGRLAMRGAGAQVGAIGPHDALALGAATGDVRVVDLFAIASVRDRALELACLRAGGGLTPDQWAVHVPTIDYEPTCPDQ